MARFNLQNIDIVPLPQQFVSQPIGLCTPLAMPPRVMRVTVDWASIGGGVLNPDLAVSVNLATQSQVSQALDAIRSIQIDNTFSEQPVFVFFPDTGFQVWAPANSTVIWPVFTNDTKAIIYIEGMTTGSVPVTNVHFSNVPREGAVIQNAGGGSTPISPIDISLVADDAQAVIGTNQFTFTAVPLGTESADRLIVVAVRLMANTVSAAALVSATIGGVAATIIQTMSANVSGDSDLILTVALIQAVVPTGATGNIVINVSSTPTSRHSHCNIGVYRLSGYASATPLSSGEDNSFTVAEQSVALDVISGAASIVVAASYQNGNSPYSYTGGASPDDFTAVLIGGTLYWASGCGSLIATSAGSIGVGTTCNVIAAASWS